MLAVGIVPVGVAVATAFAGPTRVSIDQVVQLGEGELLLVGTTGSDVDVYRLSRLALVAADGTMTVHVDHEGKFTLLGIAGDVLWVDHRELGVHARRLSDLSLLDATYGKLAAHPAVKVNPQTLGIAGDAVVVRGGDQFRYTMTADGTIEKQAKDFAFSHPLSPDALGPADARLPDGCVADDPKGMRELTEKLNATLSKPILVGCGRMRGVVAFDDPPSRLITHTVFEGEGETWELARVGLDGALLWSASMPELVASAPFEEDVAFRMPKWAGRLDGDLHALIESFASSRTSDGDDIETIEHRLVRIDPSSGAALSATDITIPE